MRHLAFLLLLVATPAAAQHDDHHHPADDEAEVSSIADQFIAAIAAEDRPALESILSPDVLILESGGIETREEYLGHHFGSDAAFLTAMTREPLHRTIHIMGDVAWVASITRLQGTFRERDLDLDSAELLVLHRTPEGWRITAVHWSSGANN